MAHVDGSAIPDAIKALIALFESELSDVKFPDVDGGTLVAASREVLSAVDRVAQAQAALQEAEADLHARQEQLLQKAQRALAYVQIYAEDVPALAEKVQAISLPRPPRRAKTEAAATGAGAEVTPIRRRGRPPKAKVESPNLFSDEGVGSRLEQAG